jgi:hypothetical protein
LDITTAVIVGVSYCWCGVGCCTVLVLAVLTDGRWKLAAHTVTPLDIITERGDGCRYRGDYDKLSKAFDLVPQNQLLMILAAWDMGSREVDWVRELLVGRIKRVN